MSVARSRLMGGLVTLVLAGATLLMCRAPLPPGMSDALPAFPSYVGRCFTLPVTMLSPSDIRLYVIFLGLAGLLLIASTSSARSTPGWERDPWQARLSRWFEIAAGLTLLIACLSAAWNDSLLLSRGWILSYAAGAGWAVLLARYVDRRAVVGILIGAAVVVFVGGLCTLWHRWQIGPQLVEAPIGPVTLLGGLGAMWSAFALARCLIGGRLWHRLIAGASLLVSVAVLAISERQTAYIALLAAIAYLAVVVILGRIRVRAARAGMILLVLVAMLIAAWMVFALWYLPGQTAASKFSARWVFWSKIFESFRDWWPLGVGPDMFVCRMTSALAPWRAEHPRLLPGNVDLDAHSEWLQAFFELGLFGGLCYVALPILACAAATRSYIRTRGRGMGGLALSCGAGLVAVLVCESASINLRYPTLQVWYWTMLGVTMAAVRPKTLPAANVGRAWRLPASIVAAGCLLMTVMGDFHRALAHAEGRTWLGRDDEDAEAHLAYAQDCWGAAHWLAVGRDLGSARLNLARGAARRSVTSQENGRSVREWAELARAALEPLYRRCSGYPTAGFRLGEALHLAGEDAAAREHLERHLKQSDPYDRPAIQLCLLIAEPECRTQQELLCRAVRGGECDRILQERLLRCVQNPGDKEAWIHRVQEAQEATLAEDPARTSSLMAPEVLRLEAFRLAAEGNLAAAADAQRRAADAYAKIAADAPALRRSLSAEVDAWYSAADMMLSSDLVEYDAALRCLNRAEMQALSAAVVQLQSHASGSLVGTDVARLAAQHMDRFARMWYLSAILHLATDQPSDQTRIRAMLSLPVHRRTEKDIDAQMVHLAGQVVRMFADLPLEKRPPGYERCGKLAGPSSRPS